MTKLQKMSEELSLSEKLKNRSREIVKAARILEDLKEDYLDLSNNDYIRDLACMTDLCNKQLQILRDSYYTLSRKYDYERLKK